MPIYKRASSRSARRYKPYAKRPRRTARLSTPTSITRTFTPFSGRSGFPTSLRTKLRYHEDVGFSSASGVVSGNVFRANSLFDPNETGTGHQPLYFDQFSAVYNRYQVVSSTITIVFSPVSEVAATSDWLVGVVGQSTNSIGSVPSTLCEQGHAKWAVINGRLGGPNQKTLTLSYTPESCLALTNKDTDVGALINANPDQSYKFLVWCADMQATGTTLLIGSVDITYDVVFSDRITVAQS